MVGMVITALLLNKYSDLLNSLALAALILLLLSPDALFLPSFQLSFLAVWAIGYLLPRILNPDSSPGGQGVSFIRQGAFLSLGNFLCFPGLSIGHLSGRGLVVSSGLPDRLDQQSYSGPFNRRFGHPHRSPGAYLGPHFFPSVFHPVLGYESDAPMDLMVNPFFCRPAPGLSDCTPAGIYGEIGFFYLTLIFLFNWRKIPKPAWLVSLSLLGMILFFFSPQIGVFFSPPFRATFLDVGHGSSILIEFPQGQKMLIDGGGSFNPEFDLGERVVGPFLWDKKITRLEVVVLTHPHPDHLNGLPFILSKFKVKEIWMNGQRVDSPAFQRLEKLIQQKKIPVVYPAAGLGPVFFECSG